MPSHHATQATFKVHHLNLSPRVLNRTVMQLERILAHLATLDLQAIDDLAALPADSDLLIVDCLRLPEDDVPKWIEKLQRKVKGQGSIWTPALILSDVGIDTLADLLEPAARENWYFDIVHPDHLESLPIRVANLLRIHDHLKELWHYQDVLKDLQEKVEDLESKVSTLETET